MTVEKETDFQKIQQIFWRSAVKHNQSLSNEVKSLVGSQREIAEGFSPWKSVFGIHHLNFCQKMKNAGPGREKKGEGVLVKRCRESFKWYQGTSSVEPWASNRTHTRHKTLLTDLFCLLCGKLPQASIITLYVSQRPKERTYSSGHSWLIWIKWDKILCSNATVWACATEWAVESLPNSCGGRHQKNLTSIFTSLHNDISPLCIGQRKVHSTGKALGKYTQQRNTTHCTVAYTNKCIQLLYNYDVQ